MATEREFWGRPFEPGPVRVDPDAAAARARVVRQALAACAVEDSDVAHHAALMLSRNASDETLAKLGRMLK